MIRISVKGDKHWIFYLVALVVINALWATAVFLIILPNIDQENAKRNEQVEQQKTIIQNMEEKINDLEHKLDELNLPDGQ